MSETKKIEVEELQLKELLEQNQQYINIISEKDAEIFALYDAIMRVLNLLGIAEEGKIKQSVKDGKAITEVIKSGASLFALAMKANIPGIGVKAEKELTEKFGFFVELWPLFEKYENQFNNEK